MSESSEFDIDLLKDQLICKSGDCKNCIKGRCLKYKSDKDSNIPCSYYQRHPVIKQYEDNIAELRNINKNTTKHIENHKMTIKQQRTTISQQGN